jgi:hypothetical protein
MHGEVTIYASYLIFNKIISYHYRLNQNFCQAHGVKLAALYSRKRKKAVFTAKYRYRCCVGQQANAFTMHLLPVKF